MIQEQVHLVKVTVTGIALTLTSFPSRLKTPTWANWGPLLVQALKLCTGRTAHRGNRGIALPFHDHGTISGWGVSVTLRPLFTPGKTRYPLYRRLGGPQGRSGQVQKISPPSRFEPRTVQPVAIRYTYWATRPTGARTYAGLIASMFTENVNQMYL